MTVRHIAAGHELTRPLTDAEYQTLHSLGLIAPCYGCTQLLLDGEEADEVVFHPNTHGPRPDHEVMAEVEAVLSPKRH